MDLKNGVKFWVEVPLDLSHIHPGAYGTADHVMYSPVEKLLVVTDYKHGAGILVECENNLQLQYYGLGALTTLEGIGEVNTVRLMVIQPRCPHPSGRVIRSWDVSALDLLEFSLDLKDFAIKTEDKKAPLVPGEHCRFCPAGAVCPELGKKAMTMAKEEFGVIESESGDVIPKVITKEEVGKALKWIPTLQAWIKSVNEHAYRESMSGRPIPGYKLVEKRAMRSWKDPTLLTNFLKENGYSDEEIYDPKTLKSPAQIEKTLPKIAKKNKLLDPFILKKSSGLTLVPDGDKRVAISSAGQAANEFTEITEGE